MIEHYYQKCANCGLYAFEYIQKPVSGDLMSAANVRHSGNPKAGDNITCQHCGVGLSTPDFNSSNLVVEREEEVF